MDLGFDDWWPHRNESWYNRTGSTAVPPALALRRETEWWFIAFVRKDSTAADHLRSAGVPLADVFAAMRPEYVPHCDARGTFGLAIPCDDGPLERGSR